MAKELSTNRLLALDYLRGFFIIVIIIDHLYLWPSLFGFLTGQGDLWVTSAEGFVIISGLLVGYIRGYKEKAQSLWSVTKKLWKRALLLYVWLIVAGALYIAAIWYIPLRGAPPWFDATPGDWGTVLQKLIFMKDEQTWVYFLYLYAIFLAIAPAVIWLLRKGWMALAVGLIIGLSVIGQLVDIEWLEWLPVFFIPAVAGFYLPTIQSWWTSIGDKRRRLFTYSFLGIGAFLLILSAISTFVIATLPVANVVNTFFSKEYVLHSWRVALALVLFVSFVLLFMRIEPFLKRWLGWLLLPFGTRSLTAYIVHGVVILTITALFPVTNNFFIDTLLGAAAIMGTWGLLKLKPVQRLLPR